MAAVRVLVVEDDETLRDLVRSYLGKEGFQVETAMDGPTGLAKARAFRPDVVVLDIMLPGLDGIEVLRQLRQESSVYVLLLTAKAEETDKVIGLSVGADDYVTNGEDDAAELPSVPSERGAAVAERDRLQPGEPLAATRVAETDRHLATDESAATPDEDGWPAREARPVLLAAAGRKARDPASIWGRSCSGLRRCQYLRDSRHFRCSRLGGHRAGGGRGVREIGCQCGRAKCGGLRRTRTRLRGGCRGGSGRKTGLGSFLWKELQESK
jgi:CheY-like chemotaxis protein